MNKNNLFGISQEMIQRQMNVKSLELPQSGPIIKGETLEPCIRGAEKINQDNELKEIVKEILA